MIYDISRHAHDQLKLRQIDLIVVDEIMCNPDIIVPDTPCKHVYQKTILVGTKYYLYRIFVNICKEPPLIITGYRTSKIEKYEN